MVEKALRIATEAHLGQVRKGDSSPYIVHPVMVALKLREHRFSDTVVAAALVHDVLEDTPFPESRLRAELGEEVVSIVNTVSEDKSLPWEERKKKYIEEVHLGSQEAKAVSAADKIHNAQSLFAAYEQDGERLWHKFSQGKEQQLWFNEEMLRMLKLSWEHPLVEEYVALVQKLKTLM